MAADNLQKIKLLKLYELLRKETDEQHPISRVQLCRRLKEMGISRNVRTLSLDIRVLREMGLYGAILGKAWYSGAVDLKEAIREAV